MKWSVRDPRVLLLAIVATIAVGLTAFFVGRVVGQREVEAVETTPATVATAVTVNRTSTSEGDMTDSVTVPVGSVNWSGSGSGANQPAGAQLPVIVDFNGPGETLPASAAVTFRVQVQGPAAEVGIALKQAEAPSGMGPTILAWQSQSDGIALYSGALGYSLAPGDYDYHAFALAPDNKTFVDGPTVRFTVIP